MKEICTVPLIQIENVNSRYRCDTVLKIDTAYSDVLINGFIPGHHSSVREESLTHSLPKLHDDLCAQRQLGGQLHDHHDCHGVSGQEEC